MANQEQNTTRNHFDAKEDYWFTIYDQTDTFPGYNLRKQHDAVTTRIYTRLNGSGSVLDVGCGAGYTALALAQQGYQVSAVDIAPNMIARGQQEAQNRALEVDFRVSPSEQLPYETGSFDVVIALGLMGNLQEDLPTLREMFRVLKPGGMVLLSMPNTCGLDRWCSLPRTYALILGYRLVRFRRRLMNGIRRLVGRPPQPLSAIRYGRSAIPWRYVRQLRAAGFTQVTYTGLTFGTFMPFGLNLWNVRQQIAISEWIINHLARWINWGGNMMLYTGEK